MSFTCAKKHNKMSNILTNLLKEKFGRLIRVDWFSCLAFVSLQYTPARPPNLIF